MLRDRRVDGAAIFNETNRSLDSTQMLGERKQSLERSRVSLAVAKRENRASRLRA